MEARLAELRTTLDAGIHQRDTVLNTIGYNLEKWTDKVQGSRIPCCFFEGEVTTKQGQTLVVTFSNGMCLLGASGKSLEFLLFVHCCRLGERRLCITH